MTNTQNEDASNAFFWALERWDGTAWALAAYIPDDGSAESPAEGCQPEDIESCQTRLDDRVIPPGGTESRYTLLFPVPPGTYRVKLSEHEDHASQSAHHVEITPEMLDDAD